MAQIDADLLDRQIAFTLALVVEPRAIIFVFCDPLISERPILNLGEDLLHFALCFLGHDARAALIAAVFRRIRDGVPHVIEATLVDQIDDQLEFVQTLEVGDLRLVARLDECLEPGLDQGRYAAAQDNLLTKQIGLGFLGEGRFKHPGARPANSFGVGQRQCLGVAGMILLDCDQAGRPAAFLKNFAHAVAGCFRGNHRHVDKRGRLKIWE